MARKAGTSSRKRPMVVQAAPVEPQMVLEPSFLNKIIEDGVVAGKRLIVWIPLVGGGRHRAELSAIDMSKVPELLTNVLRGMKNVAAVPATV